MSNTSPENTPSTGLDTPPLNALKPSEKIDRRRGPVKWVKETQAVLANDFQGGAEAILRHTVATNTSLQRMILDVLQGAPEAIIMGAELHPLVGELQRLQASTRAAIAELRLLRRGGGKGGKAKDGPTIGDLVIELDGDECKQQ